MIFFILWFGDGRAGPEQDFLRFHTKCGGWSYSFLTLLVGSYSFSGHIPKMLDVFSHNRAVSRFSNTSNAFFGVKLSIYTAYYILFYIVFILFSLKKC